jgi:3alpha(or 20beta)-hydroxysteroid dehydrogenase
MFSLENKTAVITGGASGLGLATARRFSEAGANVAIGDVNDEAGRRAEEETGGLFKHTDVGREKDVEQLMRAASERFGALDIVVNNAGVICPEEEIADARTDTYERLFRINVMGVVYGIKHGQRFMNDGGVILNTASNSANGDYAGYGPYIVSKISIVGLTKAAAIELAPRNIRVNCICPNTIDTPMAYADGCETELQVMGIQTPLGRMCRPEEAAALFHFLAADDCSYMTGEAVYIDGGLKAGPSVQMIEALLKSVERG